MANPGVVLTTQGRHGLRHHRNVKRMLGILFVVIGLLAGVAGSLGTLQSRIRPDPVEDEQMRERRFLPYVVCGACLAVGAWLLISFHRRSGTEPW